MLVYFDNSATTRPYDEVVDKVADTMKNYYGNPSSAYKLGVDAEKVLIASRNTIADTLNTEKSEIIFTSGGSESNNFSIRGYLRPDSNVVTTKIEHPSILKLCSDLEDSGIKVTYVDVDNKGKVNLSELEDSINKNTAIVTMAHVNNEIGTVQDIEKVGEIVRKKGGRTKFHVDAVQSYCKLKIDTKKMNIDMISASGHKIHGPRGVGIAYVRKGLCPKPLIFGGGQESALRSGTENLPAISGMAVAADKMYKNINSNYKKVMDLKKYFSENLGRIKDVKINSGLGEDFSPYILNVSFLGVKGEVLLHSLEEKGIYVSTGSACSAKRNSKSYVLSAIGLSDDELRGTIRFSFCEMNTKEEVDYTLEVLEKSLKFLRRLKI